ncbi:MAG: hypothetical protein RL681_8 [Candidatus Parcubacteria bacterium]|jgi:DNA polymerase-3 subunit delta'
MLIGHHDLIRRFTQLADKRQLAHGYLLFGPRRVGKATVALALANYLETGVFDWHEEKPPMLGDLLRVRLSGEGGESVGIDAVRTIRAFLAQAPNRSSVRTVVLENGELLTPSAENALLKIAEEPNLRSLIMLVVDDPERLLPTVRSRLQGIYVSPVPAEAIAQWLVSEHGVKHEEARRAADRSQGAPGRALMFAKDGDWKAREQDVREYLRLRGRARNEYVKELVSTETFSFGVFLETLVITLFPDEAAAKKQSVLWHRLMELRQNEDSYNLNPRLQLTALAEHLT